MKSTQNLTNLELFGGICGFTKGFEQAGWTFKKTYYSEKDKHAIAVAKYNNKNIIPLGNIEKINPEELPEIDIITFGSPCQDFSIAGKRAGISGDRSGLIKQAIRIIAAKKPPLFIWENVKGAYSTNQGRDFQAILAAFANIGGYRLEWQLLNTSWFLPQNRERIYLVGHLTGRSFPGVFPIGKSNELPARSKVERTGASEIHTTTTAITKNYHKTPYNGGETYIKVYPTLTPDRSEKRQNGLRFKKDGEPSFTANTQDRHGVMITETKKAFHGDSINLKALSSKTQRGEVGNQKTHTLDQECKNAVLLEQPKTTIRRLTPIECERLQGFPDNWTATGIYTDASGKEFEKKVSKTQRYKMLGNAVTTVAVEEIAYRLKECINN